MTQYPVRTIDLAAIRHNVRMIREDLPQGVLLLAVVKADAYGHGMIHVAENALAAGADWLAVARTDEGEKLRQAGIEAPILVLGAACGDEIGEGVKHGLTLAATEPAMVLEAQHQAERYGRPALVHLKLDTGMGRIGVRTEDEVRQMLDTLDACPDVRLTGAFTHFADADGADMQYTHMQFERFRALTKGLPDGLILHCANSAAIHRFPEVALHMVRAGISLYGYPPVPTDMPLRPAMTWVTAVTCVKDVHAGEKISYGCTFTAERTMRLATVACGYGDGYHRSASGKAFVIIHGKRCPVVGRICMDQMMVDVSEVEGVRRGDEAVLIGEQDGAVITAEDLAAWSGTISYEVLLAAPERVCRRWIHDVRG